MQILPSNQLGGELFGGQNQSHRYGVTLHLVWNRPLIYGYKDLSSLIVE